jgi:hypothetical protein
MLETLPDWLVILRRTSAYGSNPAHGNAKRKSSYRKHHGIYHFGQRMSESRNAFMFTIMGLKLGYALPAALRLAKRCVRLVR